jgi:hypothetical protein
MRALPQAFPRVVLGDHGFLPQYGSKLTRSEITDRMRLAIRCGVTALAAGDRAVSEAAIDAFRSENCAPIWVRHLDLPLLLDGEPILLPRAFSLLRSVATSEIGARLSTDPVMGPFFDAHRTATPYTPADCMRMTLDGRAVDTLNHEIITLKPQLVTLGGDVLDFAMASDRHDLALAFLWAIAAATHQIGACLFLCTYLGFGWPARFAPILADTGIDGFMLTVNGHGAGMVPSPQVLLEAVTRKAKPVAAMHVLVFGQIKPEPAIEYALGIPFVRTAIVGASKPSNIKALCDATCAISQHLATT